VSGATALRLATDIAAQFRYLPDDVAAEKVAAHIRMTWDPRMRAQLHEITADAGPELDPLVARAAGLLDAD
jgi:formate dehydrogenase subunit delta